MTQKSKAQLLRRLHRGPRVLLLPNAWDAASARIFETAGFPAIATTSGGVAAVLGFPDGENVPRPEMLAAIGRIARVVAVPVSADIEAGYGAKPKDVAATVKSVIAAGAVGINLEDGIRQSGKLRDIGEQVARIRAAREAGSKADVPIVINARCDVYVRRIGDESERLEHTVRRAQAYFEAGADCIFPILAPGGAIAALAREIKGPINVMVDAGTAPITELERIGVARVSLGSGPMRAAMATARRIAQQLAQRGAYDTLLGDSIPTAEMNQMMARR